MLFLLFLCVFSFFFQPPAEIFNGIVRYTRFRFHRLSFIFLHHIILHLLVFFIVDAVTCLFFDPGISREINRSIALSVVQEQKPVLTGKLIPVQIHILLRECFLRIFRLLCPAQDFPVRKILFHLPVDLFPHGIAKFFCPDPDGTIHEKTFHAAVRPDFSKKQRIGRALQKSSGIIFYINPFIVSSLPDLPDILWQSAPFLCLPVFRGSPVNHFDHTPNPPLFSMTGHAQIALLSVLLQDHPVSCPHGITGCLRNLAIPVSYSKRFSTCFSMNKPFPSGIHFKKSMRAEYSEKKGLAHYDLH